MKHNARELGRQLRDKRVAGGLSQVNVARAAGIGRSTLIHLEQGNKDVRLSNVLSIAEAVGASVGLQSGSAEQLERLRVRGEAAVKAARRRQAHSDLALDIALQRPIALRALDDARRMVSLWRKNRTCSAHYINAWSRILKGPSAQVARHIRDIDEQWLDALLQNTPFSRALGSS